MNNIIANIRTQLQKLKCRIANLSNRVTYIEDNCCNGGGDGVQSIQDGNGTDIDNTDPNNPIINILEVSATESGIVNNIPLQELGGVDKLINGVRIGRGSGNNEDNLIVGKDTLSTNTTGTYNTAFGGWVLTENTTGSFNSSFGSGALYSNTTGIYNNAFGTSTLQNNTTGSRNVGVGTSLFWNSTGQENTGVGSNAGYGATTGSQNTYIGNQAGYNNGIGSYNTAIGSRAMITSGTGIPASTLDMNRNVFIGAGLTLADGVNDVLAIDNKGATNTFYSNALLYGNFADRFLRINGRFEIDPATMPVADATYTKKLVWNPTTGVVAETDDVREEQQFVQITEGGNTGWGLKYRADNPDNYGNIGSNAIDLSYSLAPSSTIGATGQYSTVSGGGNNTASGSTSTVSGGGNNTASGSTSTVSGGGNNTASGALSTVSGGEGNTASGNFSIVSGGGSNTANSYGEWVGGLFGTIPTGQSSTSWVSTDRLFNIGNGENAVNNRSDAFTILKNGLATLPSVTNALIDAESTGKAVITKEWFEANSGGGGTSFITTTKANLDTLIANEELIPNALYEITGVQPALYGGTTIYLQAISTTELNPNGIGKFYNPKYDQTEQGFGIAVDYVYWANVGDQKPSGVYGVNDVVIWGGKHWTCIQPTTTSTKYIVDTFNLDTDYFVEIPFNDTDYNVAYDAIKYDYENDWIVERNEKNSNIVSFTYEWLKNFECDFSWIGNCSGDPNDLIQVDPIKNFQWGNILNFEDYVGIGFQRITNSVNQNINFRGSRQFNLTFDNNSYQRNLTFNNGSRQNYLTFDNNSHQYNLTFNNGSHQNYLTFDNNSHQYNLTFDSGSHQYNLTFDNSSQNNLTSSGSNRIQNNLTFNNFQSNRTGQPLSSNEFNLTFDNTVQNLPQYGQGNVTGTPAYILGVTADGKVVEMDLLQSITGYDAGETQTLKNISGVLTWVTD